MSIFSNFIFVLVLDSLQLINFQLCNGSFFPCLFTYLVIFYWPWSTMNFNLARLCISLYFDKNFWIFLRDRVKLLRNSDILGSYLFSGGKAEVILSTYAHCFKVIFLELWVFYSYWKTTSGVIPSNLTIRWSFPNLSFFTHMHWSGLFGHLWKIFIVISTCSSLLPCSLLQSLVLLVSLGSALYLSFSFWNSLLCLGSPSWITFGVVYQSHNLMQF